MLQLSSLKDKQKPGGTSRPGPGTFTEFDAGGAMLRVRNVGLPNTSPGTVSPPEASLCIRNSPMWLASPFQKVPKA